MDCPVFAPLSYGLETFVTCLTMLHDARELQMAFSSRAPGLDLNSDQILYRSQAEPER